MLQTRRPRWSGPRSRPVKIRVSMVRCRPRPPFSDASAARKQLQLAPGWVGARRTRHLSPDMRLEVAARSMTSRAAPVGGASTLHRTSLAGPSPTVNEFVEQDAHASSMDRSRHSRAASPRLRAWSRSSGQSSSRELHSRSWAGGSAVCAGRSSLATTHQASGFGCNARILASSARSHALAATGAEGAHRTRYLSPLTLLEVAARSMNSSVLPMSERLSR